MTTHPADFSIARGARASITRARAAPAGAARASGGDMQGVERFRIAFLVARDGEAAAAAWVRRTLAIYRRAVLSPSHFASTPDYRRRFLATCADFRRWLAKRALPC